MAGKKPSQDTTPPSKSSELDGAAARPASAPATRVLPQRQGLHSPRVSPAGLTSDSSRPNTANGLQRRGPEKQPVLLPDAASGQIREEAPLQHTAELQPSSPRAAKLRGGVGEAPGSPSSRPTSGSKRLTRSGEYVSMVSMMSMMQCSECSLLLLVVASAIRHPAWQAGYSHGSYAS